MKTITKIFLLVVLACGCSILIFYNVEKAKPVLETEDILLTQNKIEESILKDTKYSLEEPKIIVNPYGNSPLTALIIFETADLTSPTITIKGKDALTTITHTFTPSKVHILPIYGLYAGENEVTVKVNKTTKVLSITTDPLPSDFPKAEVTVQKEAYLSDDLYFVTPSSSGYTAAYDKNGDVRWYLSDHYLWDIQRLKNGNLLLSSNRLINPPYYMTGLMEMDLLGKIYFEYTLPGGYHHDVFEMEDGNFLVASDSFESGTVEDYVVLLERNTGNILKEINIKEIIDPQEGKSPYWTEYDWFHNNAVWYDKKTNSITLSGRHQDAVVNIDFTTSEINWILGDPTNWSEEYQKYFLTPISKDFVWQYAQHAAMILPNGDVFLFDNGNNRSKREEEGISANENYSRGIILRVNQEEKTVEEIWEYGKERGSSYYSPYISDVDYLQENHYLIHSGGHSEKQGIISNEPAGFLEGLTLTSYTTELLNDEVIFEMKLPTNTYRAEKLKLYDSNTYSMGMGERLGDMGVTKVDRKYAFLLFNKEIDDTYKKHDITITKEADRLVVSGTFKKEDKVEIILDSLFHKKIYNVRISKKPYTAMCIDIFNEEETENGIRVTKYINDKGLKGKYYIYIKINGTVYDIDQYVEY